MSDPYTIGQKLYQQVENPFGQCVGALEVEVNQNVSGELILRVLKDGPGYIPKGATCLVSEAPKSKLFTHTDCFHPDPRASVHCAGCPMTWHENEPAYAA